MRTRVGIRSTICQSRSSFCHSLLILLSLYLSGFSTLPSTTLQRRSNVVLVLKWSFLSCAVSRPSLDRIPMCSTLLSIGEHFSPDTLGCWRRRAFLAAAADTGDCRSRYIFSTESIKHLQYSSMIRSFQSRWTFCLMYSWLPTHHALSCWQNI